MSEETKPESTEAEESQEVEEVEDLEAHGIEVENDTEVADNKFDLNIACA